MRTFHLAALLLGTVGCATAANAEVIATGTGTQDTSEPVINGVSITGWNNVGYNGASGVYLGNGWVLTAEHVGSGNIDFEQTVGGQYYDYDGVHADTLTNSDGSNADLEVYYVGNVPGLSNITFATNTPTYKEEVISVGYGLVRNTAIQNGDEFAETGLNPQQRMWGDNTLTYDGGQIVYEQPDQYNGAYEYNFYGIQSEFEAYNALDSTTTPQEMEIASGDSGGALFNTSGQLIGINEGVYQQNGGYATYGDYSFFTYLTPYIQNEIYDITGVPEPTCGVAFLGLGAATILRRRRAHAAIA